MHKDDAICDLLEERNRLVAALRKIAAWELPPVVNRNGKPSTYEAEMGSNGAREYMRAVARRALEG